MHTTKQWLAGGLALMLCADALAQGGGPEAVLESVVQLKSKALPNARSNATLGPNREGTGIVIDAKGHVLTIGYLVIEAESIELTTSDNKTVPAIMVGYDHATGFGLLRATQPIGLKPIDIGSAASLNAQEPVIILPHGGRQSASIARVMSLRPFAGSWEYQLDQAIFVSPPTQAWAGAALINRDFKLVAADFHQLAVDDVALNPAHGRTIEAHAIDDGGLGVIVLKTPFAVRAASRLAHADECFLARAKPLRFGRGGCKQNCLAKCQRGKCAKTGLDKFAALHVLLPPPLPTPPGFGLYSTRFLSGATFAHTTRLRLGNSASSCAQVSIS